MLADFVSQTSPMIPAIVVSCVNEIEQRGLTEVRGHAAQVESVVFTVIWKFLINVVFITGRLIQDLRLRPDGKRAEREIP